MKKVSMVFENEQYNRLIEKKGKMTWVEFVMQLTKPSNIPSDILINKEMGPFISSGIATDCLQLQHVMKVENKK